MADKKVFLYRARAGCWKHPDPWMPLLRSYTDEACAEMAVLPRSTETVCDSPSAEDYFSSIGQWHPFDGQS